MSRELFQKQPSSHSVVQMVETNCRSEQAGSFSNLDTSHDKLGQGCMATEKKHYVFLQDKIKA